MRRLRVKGEVLCTLLLLGLLCLLLYAHQGLVPTWDPWGLQQGSTSSRALLGAPPEARRQGGAPQAPSTGPDRPRCRQENPPLKQEQGSKLQTQSKAKAQSKPPKPPSKTRGAQGKAKQKDAGGRGKTSSTAAAAAAVGPTRPPFDFQGYLREKDNRHFNLLIDQPEKCQGGRGDAPLYLLIAVKSVAADFDKRQVVRRTWGREGSLPGGVTVQTVFLLGVPRNRTALPLWDRLLAYESHAFRDVLLWDFDDTFFNLTLKETHFLNWVNASCPDVHFIFKGDADVYVNVDNILEMLRGRRTSDDLFVGDIIFHAKPIRRRNSKYYVPESVYGGGVYPSYAGGGGFVMSGHTALRLAASCQQVELFPIDDVFLGMCLQRIGLKPERHEGFRTFGIVRPSAAPHLQVFEPCFYRELMVVHSLTPTQIWLMWNLLHDPQLSCHRNLARPPLPTPGPFRWRGRNQGGEGAEEEVTEPDYAVGKVFVKH